MNSSEILELTMHPATSARLMEVILATSNQTSLREGHINEVKYHPLQPKLKKNK